MTVYIVHVDNDIELVTASELKARNTSDDIEGSYITEHEVE